MPDQTSVIMNFAIQHIVGKRPLFVRLYLDPIRPTPVRSAGGRFPRLLRYMVHRHMFEGSAGHLGKWGFLRILHYGHAAEALDPPQPCCAVVR
jgi:hypothetical protein